MVRLFIDKLGSGGTNDFVLKVDGMPDYGTVLDSYYLPEFLGIEEQSTELELLVESLISLIEYWNTRIGSTKRGQEVFLPVDFQDEYVGGLLLKEVAMGFKLKLVLSKDIAGYSVNKSVLDTVIADRKAVFDDMENVEWLISHQQLDSGLKWTLDELKKLRPHNKS
jgi:hypothetical protein